MGTSAEHLHIFILVGFLILTSSVQSQTTRWRQLDGPGRGELARLEVSKTGDLFALTMQNELYRRGANEEQWKRISLPSEFNTTLEWNITLDIAGTHFLYAHRESIVNYNPVDMAVLRSTDNGVTWETTVTGIALQTIAATHSGTIYALGTSNGSITPIYVSNNKGKSFSLLKSISVELRDMVIPSNDRLLFLSRKEKSLLEYHILNDLFKVYKPASFSSSIGGSDMTLFKGIPLVLFRDEVDILIKDVLSKRATFINTINSHIPKSILVAPSGIIYLYRPTSTDELVFSTDTALTYSAALRLPKKNAFTYVSQNSSTPLNYLFAHDSTNKLYCATSDGIFFTTDFGETWTNVGIPSCNITHIDRAPNNGLFVIEHSPLTTKYTSKSIYPELKHRYLSFPGDSVWGKENLLPGEFGRLVMTVDGLIYVTLLPSTVTNIYYADNRDPFTFTVHNSSFSTFGISNVVFFDNTLLVSKQTAANPIYVSKDNGVTWDAMMTPMTGTNLTSLKISPSNTIYLGYQPSLYRSSDMGIVWEKIITPLMNTSITSIELPTTSSIVLGTSTQGVWISNDNGSSWRRWDTGLDTVTSMTTAGGRCYVGTSRGLFSAAYGSNDWRSELFTDEGLAINTLFCDDDITVYAAPMNRGVWKKTTSASVTLDRGEHPTLLYDQSSHSLVISSLSSTAVVSLYDVVGRKVLTLSDGYYSFSEMRFRLPSILSPQVYLAVLSSNSGIASTKLMIQR